MSEPYSVGMISRILRTMPPPVLARTKPDDFHRWPTRRIVPSRIINELISNEKARRSK